MKKKPQPGRQRTTHVVAYANGRYTNRIASSSGCNATVAYLFWVQEVAGSNPVTPTIGLARVSQASDTADLGPFVGACRLCQRTPP